MALVEVELTGSIVRLEPLRIAHAGELSKAGLHPELWRLQPRPIDTPADMQAYVAEALDDQSRGVSLPFVIVHQPTGAVIGSTRFMDVALAHRRLEIGATWITPAFQRTGANVEAKLLLFTHAFESLGVNKVVLKTETLNSRSRTAILALGATQEGIFRQHLIAENGRIRDMVYFSVLSSEWAAVKARLMARLREGPHPSRAARSVNDGSSGITIRRAAADDVAGITSCVCEAYIHYIERIGSQPFAMLKNYAEVVRESQVHVAVDGPRVAGVIVLQITDEGFYVDNVAVRPTARGQGVGRRLLDLAESEARRQGYPSIYLSTHALMTENRALYSRIGYVEYDERIVRGRPRVFLRKALP